MLQEIKFQTTYGEVFGMTAGDHASQLILGIHGMSQRNGWHTWEPLLLPLAEAGFFTVSVDMPGWGKSQLAIDKTFGTAEAVTTAAEIIRGIGKQPAVVMGKSWGGGVAFLLALDYPEWVSKVIVTAPAFHEIDRLQNLRQPVLLAWAKDDPVIPFEFATVYQAAIPDIELVAYETGGHSAAPANAEAFLREAIRFLRLPNVALTGSITQQ